MRRSPALAAKRKAAFNDQDGRIRFLRQRPYAWLVAPAAAALLVRHASRVPLGQAGVTAQAWAVAGLLVGGAVLAVTPGVALLSVVARRRPLGQATALGLLYAGAATAAMGGFWAWFHSPAAGRTFCAALLVVSLTVIAVFGRRGDLGRVGLALPLALALAVAALYTGIAFLQGGPSAKPTDMIGANFWSTSDNNLPFVFAVKVAEHLPLNHFMTRTGDWLTSDRPPLQTGFVLLQWPLWSVAGRGAGYQFLGTALQAAWLPGLWVVLRVRGLSVGRTCVVVLATAATGVMFFNTVFVWPKMLAGALTLAALAIIVSRDPGDQRRGVGVLAAALATLSMLAHGGAAFALIAFVPLLYPLLRAVTVRAAARAVAACVAVAAVLYLPWTWYQHHVAPPGDRIMKWMLAGVVPIDRRGVLQTVIDQYRSLSPLHLLHNKWDNVLTLVANPQLLNHDAASPAWPGSFFGYARIVGLNDLIPAAGPLLLGAAALLLPSVRRRLADVKPLAVFTGAGIAAWVVLLWGGSITTQFHQGAYAVGTLFIGLCALGVTALPPRAAAAILTAGAAWFAVEWLPGLAFRPGSTHLPSNRPVDWSMVILASCAVAAVVVLAAAACWKRRPAADQEQPQGDDVLPASQPSSGQVPVEPAT